MLSFFFFFFFLIPLFFNFWLVQSVLFISCFLFFLINYDFDFFSLGYFLGIDMISMGLIILSFWIGSLMVMSSFSIKYFNNYSYSFIMMILFLMIFLFMSFSVMNLFMFYFFFESSLIPTLILIFGWGYQPERLNAGYYLLFYTLLASLPLLVSIFIYYDVNNSCMYMINMSFFCDFFLLYFGLIFAFLVKLPMFMFHFWLPSAHVEAPISGSMILAGVLLKLGGYGLYRVMSIVSFYFFFFNYFWISIGLYGGMFISLICVIQSDVKSLIAYSSVSHMSLVMMGIMTMSVWGGSGSYVLMLGHGLCSSGLFCLSNIIYERLGSRSFFINKGMMSFMPSMSLFWFLFCSGNMASPPSINLLGEIMIINSLICWSSFSIFFVMFISFMSACYSFYLFSYTQHGNFYSGYYSFSSGYVREYLLLILHWLPLNIFLLSVNMFILF
uniref:NADH-ubiquinone oxidoreductase chain 4 n=1 Tax=Callitettix braconoides TaxID=1245213 RepID=A0A096VHZ0_9HEMI|nr:NADH dehydrogenase subunit 4 [Callitettix braconoides]AFV32149.1 NADH dehydrogenase subunit 4 [Callitettix braconoides]